MSTKEHWDAVYAGKPPDTVSWYRPRLEQSLAWIDRCGLPSSAHVVDIGGGASTLVDDLLVRGFEKVSVVDLSQRALEQSRTRLGEDEQTISWIVGDATTPLFDDDSVDLWHDRAVFHFLADPAKRIGYVDQMRRCLRPGGFVILATFGPGGPEQCSGLPVVRYSAAAIAHALGPELELVATADEEHITPGGTTQAFAYALCQRRSG